MIKEKLNNMLLKNQWVKNEIKEEMIKHKWQNINVETNAHENTALENLGDVAKVF